MLTSLVYANFTSCQGLANNSFAIAYNLDDIMSATMNTFNEWLLSELEKRDWSQADLARRTGVSRTAISDIISGKRNMGRDMAISLAEALKLPLEEVFRAALLPPKPESNPLVEEGLYILQQLDGTEREDALRFLRMRLQVKEERETYNAKRKTKPSKA